MNTLTNDLHILMKTCGVFCLIPSYDLKTNTFKKNYLHLALITVIFVSALVISLIGRFESIYNEDSEDIILYCLPSIIITLSNVFMTFNMSMLNFDKNRVLFRKFDSFDDKLLKSFLRNVITMRRLVKIHFLIVNFFSFFIPFNEFIYYLRTGDPFIGFVYEINDIFQFYLMFIVLLYQCLLLKGVKRRFSILNSLIRKADFNLTYEIDRVIYLHNVLLDIAGIINNLFGWFNLLTFVHMFIRLLGVINSYLFSKYGWDEIILSLVWHFYIIAQGVVVAIKGGQVSDEGKKTIAASYKAVYKFSANVIMKEKLLILAQQATGRIPQFTAAGFFSIDFSMLFTFVNLITTYVIVIIQFSGSK